MQVIEEFSNELENEDPNVSGEGDQQEVKSKKEDVVLQEKDIGEKTKKKRKSKRKAVVKDEVLEAGRTIRFGLAIILVFVLVVDFLLMGYGGGSTSFVDWWDAVGTVAYLRGRHQMYNLRKKSNQKNAGWVFYVFMDSWFLYEIAGKTSRSIMRKTLVLPSLIGLLDYLFIAFLPVHFFPGDYLGEMTDKNELHLVVISAYWGLTKVRSLRGIIKEAVLVYHYNFGQSFLLSMFGLEIASVVSRIDKNINKYPIKECIRRFPGGLLAWVSTRTFMSSLFISIFVFATVKTLNIPVVWWILNTITYFWCFYRYGNGLIEKVFNISWIETIKSVRHLKPKTIEASIQKFQSRFTAYEFQNALNYFLAQAIMFARALVICLDQLNAVSKYELIKFIDRLEQLAIEIENSATKSIKID